MNENDLVRATWSAWNGATDPFGRMTSRQALTALGAGIPKRQIMERMPFLKDPEREEDLMIDETLAYKERLARTLDDAISGIKWSLYPPTPTKQQAADFPTPDTTVKNNLADLTRSRDRLRREVEAEYDLRKRKERDRLEHEAAKDLAAAINPQDVYQGAAFGFFEAVRSVVRNNRKAFE